MRKFIDKNELIKRLKDFKDEESFACAETKAMYSLIHEQVLSIIDSMPVVFDMNMLMDTVDGDVIVPEEDCRDYVICIPVEIVKEYREVKVGGINE